MPRPRIGWNTAAFALLLACVAIHLRMGWLVWGSDLTYYDDPAHFTTGAMVFEYLRHGLFSKPLDFASSFYARFPKVALGHWPPVYYVVLAAGYAVGGVSIATARMVNAGICFLLAWVLFRRLRKLHGPTIAALGAACFLALPEVQLLSWRIMSDLLVTLFAIGAVLRFAEYLDSGRPRDVVGFAVLASAAILTKGIAWSLGPFAILAPLLANRSCFRRKAYWISGLLIVAASAPFYVWSRKMNVGYPANPAELASHGLASLGRLAILRTFGHAAPLAVFAVAAVGCWMVLRRKTGTVELAMVALVLSQCVFLVVLPLTEEPRYFLPSAAALVVLAGRGMAAAGSGWRPVAIAAAIIATCGLVRPARVDGYRAAVESIPYPAHGVAMLISSDTQGEGAFIAERLETDRAQAGAVLRSSKYLAQSNWSGDNYRMLYQTPAEVLDFLHRIPVQYCVIDHSTERPPDGALLDAALRNAPEDFRLRGRFPVSGDRQGEILVYENVRDIGKPAVIPVDVGRMSFGYRLQ